MATATIDHQFAAGPLGTFYAELKVNYENPRDAAGNIDRCKFVPGSIVLIPKLTFNNPLFETVSEAQNDPSIHDTPKPDCVSGAGTLNHQDRVQCWYSGVVVGRTPSIGIPGTSIEIPGLRLAETRFKLILWVSADGSTKKTIYKDSSPV